MSFPSNRQIAPVDNSFDRLPPHSEMAEKGVLGCILQLPDESMGQCIEKLRGGSMTFYDLRHRKLYEALLDMYQSKLAIDIITVQQNLKDNGELGEVGGLGYLSELQGTPPSAHHLEAYLETVREKFALRRMIQACSSVISKSYDCDGDVDSLIDDVERSILQIGEDRAAESDASVCNSKVVMREFIDELEARHKTQGKLSGIRSGFHRLDNMTDGIQRGELFIIAARPNMGKTAIATTIATHSCVEDLVPTLIVTCEMTRKALMRRMVSAMSRVGIRSIKEGTLTEGDLRRIAMTQTTIQKAPLHFMNGISGVSIAAVCASIRRAVKQHGVQLVILDYLQKVTATTKHEKRTYEVAEVSNRLKAIAVSENVAVLALAQLNRESEKDKERKPRITDLADSGQIERDADTLCLLHRKREEARGEASLIVAKQRDGECGFVPLFFDGQFCRFESASPIRHEEEGGRELKEIK